jgi:hypothetical protein
VVFARKIVSESVPVVFVIVWDESMIWGSFATEVVAITLDAAGRTVCERMFAIGIVVELVAITLDDVGLTIVIVVLCVGNAIPANMKSLGDKKNRVRINITATRHKHLNKPLKNLISLVIDGSDLI